MTPGLRATGRIVPVIPAPGKGKTYLLGELRVRPMGERLETAT